MIKLAAFIGTFLIILHRHLINGQQQRTHFPNTATTRMSSSFAQSKVIQCPLYTECRPIFQCANQDQLKLNPKKLNYCGWRHGLPMICCKADETQIFKNKFMHRPNSKSSRITRNFEICGTRIKQISLYIVGGNQVVSNTKYPWFASIVLTGSPYMADQDENSTSTNLHHYCGSTIISDQFVISSAHCFPLSGLDESELDNYRIGVGNIELSKMQIYEVESVIIHPKASSDSHYYDIALIKIKDRFKFNSRVRPICLPFLEFGSVGEYDSSDKEHKMSSDETDKFRAPEQDLQMYGFPNYQPSDGSNYNSRAPFYGFPNPNYRPLIESTNPNQRAFRPDSPNQYATNRYQSNNFYQFRSKRSYDIKFELMNLYDDIFVKPGSHVSVAGFGDTSFGGVRSSLLKEADLMIVDKTKCNELYKKLNSPNLKLGLNDEFICAADRLAGKLNSKTSSLIDPRTKPILNRPKRSLSYWIDYFSNRIKENRATRSKKKVFDRPNENATSKTDKHSRGRKEGSVEKHVNKSSISEPNLIRSDKQTSNSNKEIKTVKKKNDEEIASDDFVLTEEELREKLSLFSDACQGDSGAGLLRSMDYRHFNKTIHEHRNDPLFKDSLKKNFDIMSNLYGQLDRKGLEGRFFLVGIVSLGRNCGDEEYPGVYVNTNYHQDWIIETLSSNGIDYNDQKYRL